MPTEHTPATIDELSQALREASSHGRTIELGGNFSKRSMGGDPVPAEVVISSRCLQRLRAYEPKDLTVSVEAGMNFSDLAETLAANGQMLPLDPPFYDNATVGGVVATNCSGPRRRRYGTARDMVIGMTFCTVDGRQVQSGGMVVKNVTGLDMAKLLIGSFGTLGSIAVVNFKVFPNPENVCTYGFSSNSLDQLRNLRRETIKGVFQPLAVDLLNNRAARLLGFELPSKFSLLVEVGGNRAALERCRREWQALASGSGAELAVVEDHQSQSLWRSVRDLTGAILTAQPVTHVLRVSALLSSPERILEAAGDFPALVRAGSGVGYIYCPGPAETQECLGRVRAAGLSGLIEHAPAGEQKLERWPNPGSEIEIMQLIKKRLDPGLLLNRGRLYNQI